VQFSCGSIAGAQATVQARPAAVDGRQASKPAARAASQELLAAALALPAGTAFAAKTETEDDENQASSLGRKQAQRRSQASPAQAPSRRRQRRRSSAGFCRDGQALAQEAKAVVLAPAPATLLPRPRRLLPRPRCLLPRPRRLPAPAHSSSAPLAAVAGAATPCLVGPRCRHAGGSGRGVLFLTRRRARRPGLIQILETAAIGPKRALLVARVNGQTMVLGASERNHSLGFAGRQDRAAGRGRDGKPARSEGTARGLWAGGDNRRPV